MQRLRRLGHLVHAPTLTGLGEGRHLLSRDITLDTFAADVRNVIEFEELDDVVLVGHSFGGTVVSAVADRMAERLSQLVCLDALLIDGGMKPFDTLPDDVVAVRRRAAEETSGGLSLPVPPPDAFGVFEPGDAAWFQRRLTPHPLGAYESPLVLERPLGNVLPCTYIACTDRFYAPLEPVRRRIRERPEWAWREIATGHDAMVSAPEALADLLEELAEAGPSGGSADEL